MSVDSELLQKLMEYNEKNSPEFTIFVNDLNYTLLGVSIENSSIPVNEPTTRGGVYFSEKLAYKIVKAVLKNKRFVLEPSFIKLIPAIKALSPYSFFDFLGRLLGGYSSMNFWTGRKDNK